MRVLRLGEPFPPDSQNGEGGSGRRPIWEPIVTRIVVQSRSPRHGPTPVPTAPVEITPIGQTRWSTGDPQATEVTGVNANGILIIDLNPGHYWVRVGCNQVGIAEQGISAGSTHYFIIDREDDSCLRCDRLCTAGSPNGLELPPGPAGGRCGEDLNSLLECPSELLLTGQVSECCTVPLLVAGILLAGGVMVLFGD